MNVAGYLLSLSTDAVFFNYRCIYKLRLVYLLKLIMHSKIFSSAAIDIGKFPFQNIILFFLFWISCVYMRIDSTYFTDNFNYLFNTQNLFWSQNSFQLCCVYANNIMYVCLRNISYYHANDTKYLRRIFI